MLLVIILLALLMVEVCGASKGRKKIRVAQEYFGTKKPTMIRYDKRDFRNDKILAIVLSVIEVVIFAAFGYMLYLGDHGADSDVYIAVALFAVFGVFLAPFTVIVWLRFLDAKLYFRNLARYGFVVPQLKEEFHYAVEGLPRTIQKRAGDESIIPVGEQRTALNGESVILAVLTGIIACILAWATLMYYKIWRFYTGNMWWMFAAITIFWLIGMIVFLIQADENRYRDEMNIDSVKSVRRSLGEGIRHGFVVVAFTGVVVGTTWGMTGTLYKQTVNYEISNLEEIRQAAQTIYNANKAMDQNWDDYDELLKQGVDAMKLQPEDSDFAYELYWTMKDMTDIDSIRYRVRTEGASYILKLEDGKIIGIYSNEHEEAGR